MFDRILDLFSKKQPEEVVPLQLPEELNTPLVRMAQKALLDQYFKRYEHSHTSELTDEIRANAKDLCDRVGAMLVALGVRSLSMSSGWRPAEVNKKIKNAAKKSLHMTGKAIDLVDTREQELYNKIAAHPELLEKYGLWLEDGNSTLGGWIHLDTGVRSPRKIRIFKP